MNPQDLTLLKEQYAQMRIDNRPQPMRELLTENPHIEREKVWPNWLLDEEKGIGEFSVGSSLKQRIRLERFHAMWRFIIPQSKKIPLRGYKVRLSGKEYWFTPQTNKVYQMLGRANNRNTVIQPAIHLLIKTMD